MGVFHEQFRHPPLVAGGFPGKSLAEGRGCRRAQRRRTCDPAARGFSRTRRGGARKCCGTHWRRASARGRTRRALAASQPSATGALAFPAFNDGRGYSKAELLRTRHGYRGEIRATGDVLIDQVAHMFRVGFSTLEIVNPHTISQLEGGKEAGIPLYYQPAAKAAAAPGSYAWRRVSA
ncbi:DUF934 domain-containing protein [Nitratireductor aquibiodomus]|uniref:DUF934 domain-containing protein n=1 Tax=Nitratireductor aquibiodomus TaxID=204799 RepID=UPI002FDEB79C